jgi:hypothetical protein
LSAPLIPVVNNADVTCLSDPQQIKDALVRQAASPVRWVETMQAMAARVSVTSMNAARARCWRVWSSAAPTAWLVVPWLTWPASKRPWPRQTLEGKSC